MSSSSAQQAPPVASRATGLDVLRAFAIVAVVFHHVRYVPGCPEWLQWPALRTGIGVDVFFVLSGWLVGGQLLAALQRTGRVPFGTFWTRRWLRTLPAYFAALAVLVGLGLVKRDHLGTLVLFGQNYLAPWDWLVTWSLCVEEHFYLLLPAVTWLLWQLRNQPRVLASAVLLLLVAPVALRAWGHADMARGTYAAFVADHYQRTHLRLDGLALGVAAAALQRFRAPLWARLEARARPLAWLGALLLLGVPLNPWLTGFTLQGTDRMTFFSWVLLFPCINVGTALMLPLCARLDAPARPVSTWVAEHSYALYLVHASVMQALGGKLTRAGWNYFSALAVCVAVSVLLAVLLRRLVEVPGLALRDRVLRTRAR